MAKICLKCGNQYDETDKTKCPCGAKLWEYKRPAFPFYLSAILFYIINAAIMLPILWGKSQQWDYAGIAAGFLVIAIIFITKKETMPGGLLPAVAFIDILMLFGVNWDIWVPLMSIDNIEMLERAIGAWVVFLIIGLLLWRRYAKRSRFRYQFLAMELWAMIPMMGWDMDSDELPVLGMVLLVYTFINFTWVIMQKLALMTRALGRGILNWMTIGIYAIYTFLVLACGVTLETCSMHLFGQLHALTDVYLSNGRVIAAVIIAFITAVAVGGIDPERSGSNSMIAAGTGCAVLLLKAVSVYYVPIGFISLFVFGIGFVRLFRRERNNGIDYEFSGMLMLIVFTLGIISVQYLVSIGLWPVAAAGVVAARYVVPKRRMDMNLHPYRTLILWMAGLAALTGLLHRIHTDNLWMIALILVSCAVVFVFAEWKHPVLVPNRKWFKRVICLLAGFMMLLAVTKGGTDIRMTYQPESESIAIEVTPKEEGSTLESVSFHWTGMFEESDEYALSVYAFADGAAAEIAAEQGHLVVRTLDSNGVVTKRTAYFPYVFYMMEEYY